MAGMCCGVSIGETEAASPRRRRRMEIHQFNFAPTDSAAGGRRKRQKIAAVAPVVAPKSDFHEEKENKEVNLLNGGAEAAIGKSFSSMDLKFGVTSVCGRRRDMEDAVSIHSSFCPSDLHFFGVYDGHGCSHVATRCKERMHEILKEELQIGEQSWERRMKETFLKMDREVTQCGAGHKSTSASGCRCELRTPQCDAVGSTAVVAVVTPGEIVVSNCGDSRAVLCRNGVAFPLSVDHKPDRPDELNRIREAGGRVIYWDGPRVLGVLAMSRAIGDNYLKPYVISEPEVTVTARTADDECLILASDGLWDVVSNETACGVARMCLQSRKPQPEESSGKACSDASILLTKLALARRSTDNVSVVVVDLRKGL
ncbi:protein phosphatase 2C 37-like [Andrographis paniculata]|uniref:protein phosphatase 2C 37-like n=1 Tax=Andrographis paniculata TaxID=175694 RepID=UPI0021E99A75|nr:protein phosphatase 2C 37-like [Andrographis paniculata]